MQSPARHRLALKLACVFAFAWVHRTTECHYNPHRRSILCRHARVLYNCVFLELLMQRGAGKSELLMSGATGGANFLIHVQSFGN